MDYGTHNPFAWPFQVELPKITTTIRLLTFPAGLKMQLAKADPSRLQLGFTALVAAKVFLTLPVAGVTTNFIEIPTREILWFDESHGGDSHIIEWFGSGTALGDAVSVIEVRRVG